MPEKATEPAALERIRRAAAWVETTFGHYPAEARATLINTATWALAREERAVEYSNVKGTVELPPRKQTIVVQSDTKEGPLAKALQDWRARTAKEQSRPRHHILHNRTLFAIAQVQPRTLEELARVPGLGEWKLKHYGSDLLKIIAEHADTTPVKMRPGETAGPPPKQQYLTGQAAVDRSLELNVVDVLKEKGPLTQATLFAGKEEMGVDDTRAIVSALNRLRKQGLVLLKDGKYRLRKQSAANV